MNAQSSLPNLKSGRTATSSEPWAILIALASLIIVATGIAIIVICILWEKYKKSRLLFERNITGLTFDIPATASITNIELRPKEYEVQSLDMYVPQDGDDLAVTVGGGGEVNLAYGTSLRRSFHTQLPPPIPTALPPTSSSYIHHPHHHHHHHDYHPHHLPYCSHTGGTTMGTMDELMMMSSAAYPPPLRY